MSPESGKRWPWWARALVGVFALIGVLYVSVLLLISRSCFVTDLAIVPSLSGTRTARISERQCRNDAPIMEITVNRGQPDGRSMAEVVFAASERPDENGAYARIPLRVAWADGDELQVYHPYAFPFRNRVEGALGVKISYHEIAPGSR